MNDAKFSTLLTLYRAAHFKAGRAATLVVANEALRAALETCLGDVYEYAVILADGDPDDIVLGATVELEFGDPRTGLGILADNLAGLLQAPRHRIREPRNYFLIDQKVAQEDTPAPADLDRYRQVLAFVDLLGKAAAFLDVEAVALVFVHGGKFELPVNYSAALLARVDAAALSQLLAFVGDDAHNQQKLGILEGAVRALIAPLDPPERFARLLAQLPELAANANDGYRLFISNFSFDKVRDSLEATKVEYATKIHKAFSDIQMQILSIPVATVVVASQMKLAGAVGYEFWLNSAVLVGCWVFVVLMVFVLSNQWQTLAVLADEINRQRTQIEKEYRGIASRFVDVFTFLERRLRVQRRALFAVGCVLAVGLVLAHVVYFKLTEPASAWLGSKSGNPIARPVSKSTPTPGPAFATAAKTASSPAPGVAPLSASAVTAGPASGKP